MENGDAGNKDRGGDGDVGDVVRDCLDVIAGEVADARPSGTPENRANGREEQEPPERHLGDTDHDAEELPHAFDVATEHDEPATTTVEESLDPVDALRREADDLPVSLQQASAAGASDPVADA